MTWLVALLAVNVALMKVGVADEAKLSSLMWNDMYMWRTERKCGADT